MKNIYIPVDNRPCNNIFPSQLAKLQNVNLLLPPSDILDDFTKPSDYEKLRQWLFNNCTQDTILVLSVDNFVLGSLLNSRKNTISIDESINRMEGIKELKEKFSNMKIYAFSVLMRTSISTFSTEGIKNWSLVNEYSQLVHKVELYGKKEDKDRIKELEKEIPNEILETFLYSRKRNNTVNKMCINYVNEGIFESVSILQEDSTPFGVHKKEQSELLALIEKYNLFEKVHIHNGTDEAGCITVAKAIVEQNNLTTKLSYQYLNDNRSTFIASYEDRPFHENLLSHSKTAGIKLYDNDDSINNVLIIYTPADKQYEASLGDGTPPCDYTNDELDGFARKIANQIKKGKRVYLLDVAYANGGQGEILRHIHKYANINKLSGYSAWNTASNALGTILAQIILSQNADEKENLKFTFERLIDDYAYQGVVRKRLEYKLQEKDEDKLNIKDVDMANNELSKLINEFLNSEEMFKEQNIDVASSLPWPRIFEAKILLKP